MRWLLLAGIRLYRAVLSPLLPPACRFQPSCSAYASEAIARHGAVTGLKLAVGRILRCHPFRQGGFDPVPTTVEKGHGCRYMSHRPHDGAA